MKTVRSLKQHTHCLNCGLPIPVKEIKDWRWAAWSVSNTSDSSPQREMKDVLDHYDFAFHKPCFGEYIENRNGFDQDLAKPMNNCIYFHRTGSSMHGYYIRDDKKHPCLAAWTHDDISGQSIFPTTILETRLDLDCVKIVIDSKAFLEAFCAFLKKNGWLNEGWFAPRKEFIFKDAVAKRMQEEAAKGTDHG